jgi:hypothetical protein
MGSKIRDKCHKRGANSRDVLYFIKYCLLSNMQSTTALLLCLALFTCGCSSRIDHFVALIDSDGDRHLSPSEFSAYVTAIDPDAGVTAPNDVLALFSTLDQNKDALLSSSELLDLLPDESAKRVAKFSPALNPSGLHPHDVPPRAGPPSPRRPR